MECVGSRCRRDIHMVIKGHDVTCKERSTVCMQRREREVICVDVIWMLPAQRAITKARPRM